MTNRFAKAGVAALALGAAALGGAAERAWFDSHVVSPSAAGAIVRNAYPTVAALPDGRLLLVWSTDSRGRKNRVVGSLSSDAGATWSPPEDVIDTPGWGDHDPNIVVTDRDVQVYTTTTPMPQKVIDRADTWRATRRLDGGAWSKPERIPAHRKYVVGKIHAGVTLADGTLLMPYSWDVPAEEGRPSTTEAGMELRSGALRSRDGGRTWTPGGDIVGSPPRKSSHAAGGVDEPAMAVVGAGEVYALLRTPDIWMYESRSRDGGRTWSPALPSKLQGHNAPAALCRLRGLPDVFVVWDNSPRDRRPLAVAISTDDCRTWSRPKTLANPAGVQASYPSAAQAADGTLVAVWQQDRPERQGRDIWIARFSRAWVLE